MYDIITSFPLSSALSQTAGISLCSLFIVITFMYVYIGRCIYIPKHILLSLYSCMYVFMADHLALDS